MPTQLKRSRKAHAGLGAHRRAGDVIATMRHARNPVGVKPPETNPALPAARCRVTRPRRPARAAFSGYLIFRTAVASASRSARVL
jgi:hypothetical protein